MADESDPVEAGELVMRRILNKSEFVNLELELPVNRLAFRPTSDDTDGISLYRSAFTTAATIANSGSNPLGYFVAEIATENVRDEGLSVVQDPLSDGPRGHCLIPEIRVETRDATKLQQFALARLASVNLVHKPA